MELIHDFQVQSNLLFHDQNQLFWLRNKHTPSILSAVQQIPALKQITQIKWTMAPCGTVPKIHKKNTNLPKKTLNAKDQTIIRASAETIKDDALKKALLKLAET